MPELVVLEFEVPGSSRPRQVRRGPVAVQHGPPGTLGQQFFLRHRHVQRPAVTGHGLVPVLVLIRIVAPFLPSVLGLGTRLLRGFVGHVVHARPVEGLLHLEQHELVLGIRVLSRGRIGRRIRSRVAVSHQPTHLPVRSHPLTLGLLLLLLWWHRGRLEPAKILVQSPCQFPLLLRNVCSFGPSLELIEQDLGEPQDLVLAEVDPQEGRVERQNSEAEVRRVGEGAVVVGDQLLDDPNLRQLEHPPHELGLVRGRAALSIRKTSTAGSAGAGGGVGVVEAMKASTPVTERLALGQELPTRVHGGLSMLRRCSTPAFRETQRQESAGVGSTTKS